MLTQRLQSVLEKILVDQYITQAGSGRKATERKVQFRGLPPRKKRKTIVLEQGQDDFEL